MKFILSILLSSLFFFMCAAPGAGPGGYLFSRVKLGIFSTGDKSNIQDKSCIHSIMGLLSFGDASIEKIKGIQGIKEVTDVNWETNSFFGIYASLCVIVGGKK